MDTAEVHWRPLGTLLVERGLLSAEELDDALEAQRETGKRLGEILVERGLISHPALSDTLAHQYGIELSSESGFGTGLRALIEQRHSESRPGVLPAPSIDETAESEVETAELELDGMLRASGRLIALEPQLEEHWARLAAAEASVAERDAVIEALEQERTERVFAAAAQTKALNRRLGALRKKLTERERKATSLGTQIGVARGARDRVTRELETIRAELEAAQGILAEEQAELSSLRAELETERVQGDASSKDRDKLVQGLEERLEAAIRERDQEQAQGRQLRDALDSLEAELENERAHRDASASDRQGLETRLEAAVRERDQEQAQGRQLRDALDSLQAELENERAHRDASANARTELETQLEAAARERNQLRGELNSLRAELQDEQAHRDASAHARTELETRLEAAASERDQLRGELNSLQAELQDERARRDASAHARTELETRLEAAAGERDQLRDELSSLQAELDRERTHRDASAKDRDALTHGLQERLEAAIRERDQEQAQGRQLLGELSSLHAELDEERIGRQASEHEHEETVERLRDDAFSLQCDRDALAAELAEARIALASAEEQAGHAATADSTREEQGRTVVTLAVVLDEIRRERDTAREAHSEALRGLAQLEHERDEQTRALEEARATAIEQEVRAQGLDQDLQHRLGELGSGHSDRSKLAQLVKRLGDEQSDRQSRLAEATGLAGRQRRRTDEPVDAAAGQEERECDERARLVPRLEELQRQVAASEQRLATAAVRVLGERRRQDEERRRAEAAEAAARRYKHRLSELEQSGAQPA